MLSRLHLVNFRRHRDTAVDFDDTSRLILIEGANGAGKSTLVEAILWALYGEGRDGRANLDSLVRRGGEDEGMEVTVEFERGGRAYRAVRSRRRGHSRARLELDGVEIARSPSAVTSEVTRMFGVDAAGFRLAVYAQQKELDALASLQPARRSAMLGRLLGIDAVAAARNDAASAARTARAALETLGGSDLDDARAGVTRAETARDEAHQRELTLRAQLDELQSQLDELTAAEGEYQRAHRAHLGAVGARDQVTAHLARIDAELEGDAELTELPGGDVDLLTDQALELHRRLQQGERDHELWQQRAQIVHERDQLHRQLIATIEQVDTSRDAAARADTLALHEAELERSIATLRAQVADKGDALSRLTQQVTDADTALDALDTLGEQCDRCGQSVDGEHRHDLHRRRRDTKRRLGRQLTRATQAHRHAAAELAAAEQDLEQLRHQLAAARHSAAQLDRLCDTERELVTRRNQLDASLQRRPENEPDLAHLRSLVADVDTRLRQARQARDHNARVAQRRRRREELTGERLRLTAELDRLEQSRPGDELVAAHQRHTVLTAERARLLDTHHQLRSDVAVATERVGTAQAVLAAAEQRHAQRQTLTAQAQVSQAAARILDEVGDTLAARLRPALEAEVSQLLDLLSEGRYSRVRFDDEFNCEVDDDGAFQPLASLSGGEIDLVALAVRLALGAIVADGNSGAGPEFLILDECFGSQDAARQQAIVSALRQLGDTYRQVLVISHVPGVRDSVDRVVSIVSGVDEHGRSASVD